MNLMSYHRLINKQQYKVILTCQIELVSYYISELFHPNMGQFTYWTPTVPVKGTQFRYMYLGQKHSSQ